MHHMQLNKITMQSWSHEIAQFEGTRQASHSYSDVTPMLVLPRNLERLWQYFNDCNVEKSGQHTRTDEQGRQKGEHAK